MIASLTCHTSFFSLLFVLYFFMKKLTLLLLSSYLSFSQLYSLFQATLLPLTLIYVILFPVLEGDSHEVHVKELLLPPG